MPKRKENDEYRTFQHKWIEGFAFMERICSVVCLICGNKILSMKWLNVKETFRHTPCNICVEIPEGKSKKKACQELPRRVKASQQQLRVWIRQDNSNSASFSCSLAVVRNGKLFTDGEFSKKFLLDVANELFEDFLDKDRIIKR